MSTNQREPAWINDTEDDNDDHDDDDEDLNDNETAVLSPAHRSYGCSADV